MPTIDEIIATLGRGGMDATAAGARLLAVYAKKAEAAIVTQMGALTADVAVLRSERSAAGVELDAARDESIRLREEHHALGKEHGVALHILDELHGILGVGESHESLLGAVRKLVAERDGKPAAMPLREAMRFTHVAEWFIGGLWWQQQFTDGPSRRLNPASDRSPGGWSPWQSVLLPTGSHEQMCRLVPVAAMNDDPATRGPIGGSP